MLYIQYNGAYWFPKKNHHTNEISLTNFLNSPLACKKMYFFLFLVAINFIYFCYGCNFRGGRHFFFHLHFHYILHEEVGDTLTDWQNERIGLHIYGCIKLYVWKGLKKNKTNYTNLTIQNILELVARILLQYIVGIIATIQPTTQNNLKQLLLVWFYYR